MMMWERIEGGIRKFFSWGQSEVYMEKVEDCFSKDELEEVIIRLSSLPLDSLNSDDLKLLASLKAKRSGLR